MSSAAPTLLDAWIEDFNPRQKEAYEFDGHCVVLAGPGSGKTRVLVARVARLLTQRAKGPRGVACVTFNYEAEREMRRRLRDLGLNPGKRLFIGTVHSFCLACIVAPFGRLFCKNIDSALAVAGTSQQKHAFQTALADVGLNGPNAVSRGQFDEYRRAHPIRNDGKLHEDPELARLVARYESVLRNQGLLDFDGLVHLALDLIRRHEFVRSAVEARFPFLVVDEYQDLGYPLHLITREFMRDTQMEVFAVGDLDQSIYGFIGADPKYLLGLAQESGVHRINLDMNYRSAQLIIDSSLLALASEEPRNYVSARIGKEGRLCLLECPNGLSHQAELIATRLLPHLKQQGIPDDQIAILYIDRLDAPILSQALNEAGIKYAGERDRRYPRTPFTRWLEDVATWCVLFPEIQRGPRLDDLLFRYAEMSEQAGLLVDTGHLAVRTGFFGALKSVATPNMPLVEWLKQLDNLLNLTARLRARKAHPDDLADWELITRDCLGGGALAAFCLDDFARCRGRPDTVTLTTLHSSKGLEYEVVIMPGLEEGRLPRYSAVTANAIAEARRVFYVGMTRAKDSIYLLSSGWYKNQYGRAWNNGTSRFVSELRSKNSFTKAFRIEN